MPKEVRAPKRKASTAIVLSAEDQRQKDIVSTVTKLAKGGRMLNHTDTRHLHKLAEISQDVSKAALSTLVANCAGAPMIRMTQSDGTPVNVKKK